jgi:hypothetical protein
MTTEDIAHDIETYIEIDEELANVAKETKELRKNKKLLEERITEYMVAQHMPIYRFQDGSGLSLKKTKTKETLSKKYILEFAQKKLGSSAATTFVNEMEASREEKEHVTIKRNKTRKRAKKQEPVDDDMGEDDDSVEDDEEL